MCRYQTRGTACQTAAGLRVHYFTSGPDSEDFRLNKEIPDVFPSSKNCMNFVLGRLGWKGSLRKERFQKCLVPCPPFIGAIVPCFLVALLEGATLGECAFWYVCPRNVTPPAVGWCISVGRVPSPRFVRTAMTARASTLTVLTELPGFFFCVWFSFQRSKGSVFLAPCFFEDKSAPLRSVGAGGPHRRLGG